MRIDKWLCDMIEIKQFILRHLCEAELCQFFFDAYVKDYPKIHINPMIVLADIRKNSPAYSVTLQLTIYFSINLFKKQFLDVGQL